MFPGHKKGMGMISTSEYCAVGHPDRTCDFIASYLLDKYLEHDRTARVALEVQLKDNFCTVAGEVSANWRFTESEIAELVREAIRKVGYTDKYRAKWGHENAISGSDVEVTVHLSQQSGDIAQGVNREGWGDQGIFFGMAVNDRIHGYMPLDYWLAREIANALVKSGWGGIDIKTQVTVEDGRAIECVVAIPLDPATEDEKKRLIADYVKATVGNDCEVIVNGTGRYVTHGPIGDCGTTGRKLVTYDASLALKVVLPEPFRPATSTMAGEPLRLSSDASLPIKAASSSWTSTAATPRSAAALRGARTRPRQTSP